MSMFLYLDKDTPLHRLNPVTRILGLLLLFILSLYWSNPLYLLCLLIFALLLVHIGRAWVNLRKMLYFLLLLAVFSTILWSFFYKGERVLFKIGVFSVTRESLLYGLGMGIRLDFLLISGLIFISCTKVEEFTLALKRMGLPYPVCFSLSLAFRLVPLFYGAASTILQAQKSRGLDLESGNLLQRIKKYIPLLTPIFLYAVRNVDQLAVALESKGFGTRKERSYYLKFTTGRGDYLALTLLGLSNLACIYFKLR